MKTLTLITSSETILGSHLLPPGLEITPNQGYTSSTTYDLIANVIHESVAGTTRDKASTAWKVQLRAGSGGGENEKWFQIQDLIVEELRKEMIFLGETVLQVRYHFLMSSCHSDLVFRYGNGECDYIDRYSSCRRLAIS